MASQEKTPEREFANKILDYINRTRNEPIAVKTGNIVISPIPESFYQFIAELLAAYRASVPDRTNRAKLATDFLERYPAEVFVSSHQMLTNFLLFLYATEPK